MRARRVSPWTLNARRFDAIARGLETTMRGTRKSLAQVTAEPTSDHHHVWRRRVKDLWFQMRLLETRCGNKLLDEQRRLEALDGCLGEYHNVILLEKILVHGALVSRRETASGLHIMRQYQAVLRRRAVQMASRILCEKPRHFVRRVERLWKTAPAAGRAPARKGTWRRAA